MNPIRRDTGCGHSFQRGVRICQRGGKWFLAKKMFLRSRRQTDRLRILLEG